MYDLEPWNITIPGSSPKPIPRTRSRSKELFDEAEICPNCGVRQPNTAAGTKPNRVTAAVLALFLGGIGIHRFYMRKTVSGILYLILCWTFIPAVLALIEFFIYICSSDASFEKQCGI
jgi:TM2 domain-containing membrane protein YozV